MNREKVRKMHIYSNKETAADLREDLIAVSCYLYIYIYIYIYFIKNQLFIIKIY